MPVAISKDRKDVFYRSVEDEEEEKEEIYREAAPTIGIRHAQAILYFLLIFVGFGTRVSFSIAVVSMTDPKASSNPNIPVYNWTDKSVILSAFFWGYPIPQIFAGYAANRFGAKWFLVSTTAVQSILMLLVPWIAADLGSKGLYFCRAVQGLCQGFLMPSCAHLLSQWVPHEERSRLAGFVFGGVTFGTVVSLFVTGMISASWYGWPMVFYVYGGFGLIISMLFSFLGYDSPAIHPSISKEEKYYIEHSLGHMDEKLTHKVPWKSIFTSVPVWALFIVQCGNNYCFWTLLTQIPSYMSYVMNFSMKDNSMLSALPYLVHWVLIIPFSFTSDYIINKKIISRTVSRKIFNSLGLSVPAVALIYLGFTRADQTLQAVVLLIVAVGCNAAVVGGWGINHLDLSPNFAGTLTGLTNGFSNVPALLAPLIVQVIVTNEKDPLQWRTVFFAAAICNIIVSLVFILFGSGKVQSWNEDQDDEKEDER